MPGRQLLDPFSSLCACAFLETYPCWHRHGNRQCDAQAPYAIAGARPLFIRRSIDATRCKLTPPQFSPLWTGLQEQLARRVCLHERECVQDLYLGLGSGPHRRGD